MKNIYKLFVIVFVPLLFIVKVNASNTGYIENMYSPGGVNVISYDNITVEDNVLSNTYPIYVNRTNIAFSVQLRYETYFDNGNNKRVEVEVFDKNFNIIETKSMYFKYTMNVETENGLKTYYYETMLLNYYVYALRIKSIDVKSDFEEYGIEAIMGSFSTTQLNQYVPYVEKSVFINLLNKHPSVYVSYDKVLTQNDVRSFLVAEDVYRGIITDDIVIDLTAYKASSSKIGQYQVDLEVSDGYNTFSTYIYIKVVDKKAPTILGKDTIEFPVGDLIREEMILEGYQALDEYDGDITKSIYISSEYINEMMSVSSQQVDLTVYDASGNHTTKTITINAIDNLPPTITGDTTIYVGYEIAITKEKIVENYFVVKDNLDKNPTTTFINDGYTGNESTVGTWKFTIKATDASGNIKEKEITIVVSDAIPPVIYIDMYQIELDGSIALTEDDFASLLFESGELEKNKKYKARVINDTYHGSENITGTYLYQVEYSSDDGEKLNKSFKIIVKTTEYIVSKPKIGFEEIIIGVLSLTSITLVIVVCVRGKKIKRMDNKEV